MSCLPGLSYICFVGYPQTSIEIEGPGLNEWPPLQQQAAVEAVGGRCWPDVASTFTRLYNRGEASGLRGLRFVRVQGVVVK